MAGKGKERAEESSGSESDLENDTPSMFTQSLEDKRSISKGLRDSLKDLEEMRRNLLDTPMEQLTKQVAKSELLFAKVLAPAQAVLDSKNLKIQIEMGVLKARQLKLDALAFDTDEFLSRAIQYLGGTGPAPIEIDSDGEQIQVQNVGSKRKLDWERAGTLLAKESRRVPAIDFMFGALAVETKVKKARVKKVKEVVNEAMRANPQDITAADMEKDTQETTRMVASVSTVLSQMAGADTLPFLGFIVNPDSFSQTVENLFYFAFLIKEGKAAIEMDEDPESPYFGDAVTFVCEAASEVDVAGGATKSQLVIELDYATWKSAVKTYKIKSSCIPTRVNAEPKGKKPGWY